MQQGPCKPGEKRVTEGKGRAGQQASRVIHVLLTWLSKSLQDGIKLTAKSGLQVLCPESFWKPLTLTLILSAFEGSSKELSLGAGAWALFINKPLHSIPHVSIITRYHCFVFKKIQILFTLSSHIKYRINILFLKLKKKFNWSILYNISLWCTISGIQEFSKFFNAHHS